MDLGFLFLGRCSNHLHITLFLALHIGEYPFDLEVRKTKSSKQKKIEKRSITIQLTYDENMNKQCPPALDVPFFPTHADDPRPPQKTHINDFWP